MFCARASCPPAPFSPSLLYCVTSKMKAYKLLSSTHCQMVSSGFLPMVYIVEFWETKGRKEACSCLVQASEPASLRRGSWLPLRSTPSGIKALILNFPLLPSVLSTPLPPDTPRLHTSAQGRETPWAPGHSLFNTVSLTALHFL